MAAIFLIRPMALIAIILLITTPEVHSAELVGMKSGVSVTSKNATSVVPSFDDIFKTCVLPHPLINCSAGTTSKLGEDFTAQCMPGKRGVLRLIGEYDVLTIHCRAGFNLDFDYDGFQPTEAIKILFWNVVNSENATKELSTSEYHMKIDIYSNVALHRLYSGRVKPIIVNLNQTEANVTMAAIYNTTMTNNATTATALEMPELPFHKYSRTGNYIFRGMAKNNSQHRIPVYLFMEEPGLEPMIMLNNFTKPSEIATNRIQVPCRPSHYNATVEIHRITENKRLRITSGDFNPIQGFTVPVEATRDLIIFQVVPTTFGIDSWKFQCNTASHSVNMSYPGSSTENAFGFDTVPQVPSRNPQPPINVEPNPITYDPITVNITCVIDDPSRPNAYLGAIGYSNPSEIRLVHEFILPKFNEKSYTARIITHNNKSPQSELKILGARMAGVYYCEAGPGYNKIEEYAIALNKKYYRLDFNTNYAILPHTSPPTEAHVQLKLIQEESPADEMEATILSSSAIKLIAGRTYNFSCRIDTFTMGRTIIWELYWKNGSRSIERIDYHFEGEFQYFSLKATWDLANISCSTPYWNKDIWQASRRRLLIQGEEIISPAGVYSIGGAAVIIIILVLLFLLYRKQRNEQWQFTRPEIVEFETGNPYVSMHKGLHEGGSNLPYDKRYELDPNNFRIVYENILGQGEFGIVYYGFVGDKEVGVKTVKNKHDKLLVKGLLAELKIMIYLGHNENLLELVGAYTSQLRQGTALMFLEYCPLGSLESYLQKHRYQLEGINNAPSAYSRIAYLNPNENGTGPKPLTMLDLFTWCHQIANGMSYLSDKKVIHGDLATRNVLLTAGKVAKICDFGLSRRLHNYKTYMKDSKSQPLPWAWMAPEALLNFAFSIESDVWSFGITIWEIFSLGARPYPGLNFGLDFVQRLKNGLRNLQPELAPTELYREIMKECWRYEPQDRPSFTEICINLEYFLEANATTESRQSLSSGSDSGVSVTVVNSYSNVNNNNMHDLD